MSSVPNDSPWLVVGLGNPGDAYRGNRHNVGHMALERLADGTAFRAAKRGGAVVVEGRLGGMPGAPGPRAILAKTSTFMNVSGRPVSALAAFYGISPAKIIVVHDEIDIPFGALRIKLGGGEGGHNGLRDISKALGTRDYLRLRVGVGRPPGRTDAADHVLRDFSGAERKDLPLLLSEATDAVEELVMSGLVAAQQRFHAPAP